MKKLHIFIISIFASVLLVSAVPVRAQERATSMPAVVISEVQTGGLSGSTEDGRLEFIELYNPHEKFVSLDGWQLEYLSATHDGTTAPTRILASLQGILMAGEFKIAASADYPDVDFPFQASGTGASGALARSGGHVRLVNVSGQVIDLVSWGTAMLISTWWKSPEIPAGMSIQRILPADPAYTTGLSFAAPTASTTPGAEPPLSQPPEPEPPLPPACAGLVLSELLPNAVGSDDGKEFIEVYNPADQAISLKGCALRLGEDGKVFDLPDELLGPKAYHAFYDGQTGITLPNATAQSLWLLAGTEPQQQVTYADNMEEGSSWALIAEEVWSVTTLPTPNAANQSSPIIPVAVTTVKSKPIPSDCPAGKERNPATNRCRTSVSSAQPTACKPDQERNPETNRCRSVLAASTAPKPCPAGQERNPTTNRCRKVAATSAAHFAKVQDVPSASIAGNYRWWLVGAVILSAGGYAIYEWRHDLANWLHHRKLRWLSKKNSD